MADSEGPVAVALDRVSKDYATTTAVDDVSIDVREGEFFTFVGPSGCGKTTTLRLIGGFEDPSSGTIRIDGDDVRGLAPEARDVGIVFQNYALFPHMSVRENVAYGLKFTDPPGGQSVDERVDELLALVDLSGMGDRDPAELSGGQRQRIALARALAPEPSVLLLDEPLSALDAELREHLRVQLREIQQDLGITTIYVTHDQEEALAISDRVAVMHDGGIEQVGTPREIYQRPASRFVATFVGDNNVFEGELVAVQRGTEGGDESTGGDGTDGETGAIAEIAVNGQHLRVAIDEETAEDWRGSLPRGGADGSEKVLFCVRPEYLVVDHPENTLSATVRNAEFLGVTTRVALDWEGMELVARTRGELNGTVRLGFHPGDAHVVSRGE